MSEELIEADEPQTAIVRHVPDEDVIGYVGASLLVVTKAEAAALAEPFEDESEHDILPTGEIYASQVFYRRRLNAVFGPGQWSILPRGDFAYDKSNNVVTRPYALFVRGHFISESVGEQGYFSTNKRMSYATACEAAKSNALVRCCKDLGVGSECWDKRFAQRFKDAFCACFKVKDDYQWRRLDAPPFKGEGERVDRPRKGAAAAPQSLQEPQKPALSDEDKKRLNGALRKAYPSADAALRETKLKETAKHVCGIEDLSLLTPKFVQDIISTLAGE